MMKVHRVQQINQQLFSWMAAGFEPTEAILSVALWMSKNGVWIASIAIVWALWRTPAHRRFLLSAVMLCGVATVLAHEIAGMANIPRPFVLGLSPNYLAHSGRPGFPSAHSAAMWSLAFACFHRRELRAQGWWLSICAAMTTLARVYSGAHFPLDIAAGMVLAAFLAILFKLTRSSATAYSSSTRNLRRNDDSLDAPIR